MIFTADQKNYFFSLGAEYNRISQEIATIDQQTEATTGAKGPILENKRKVTEKRKKLDKKTTFATIAENIKKGWNNNKNKSGTIIKVVLYALLIGGVLTVAGLFPVLTAIINFLGVLPYLPIGYLGIQTLLVERKKHKLDAEIEGFDNQIASLDNNHFVQRKNDLQNQLSVCIQQIHGFIRTVEPQNAELIFNRAAANNQFDFSALPTYYTDGSYAPIQPQPVQQPVHQPVPNIQPTYQPGYQQPVQPTPLQPNPQPQYGFQNGGRISTPYAMPVGQPTFAPAATPNQGYQPTPIFQPYQQAQNPYLHPAGSLSPNSQSQYEFQNGGRMSNPYARSYTPEEIENLRRLGIIRGPNINIPMDDPQSGHSL